MDFEPTNSATVMSTSDASPYVDGPARPLTQAEMDLIFALLDKLPDGASLRSQVPGSLVQTMNDGGMGSLRFVTSGSDRLHREAVTARAVDEEDGVPIEISINLDEKGTSSNWISGR